MYHTQRRRGGGLLLGVLISLVLLVLVALPLAVGLILTHPPRHAPAVTPRSVGLAYVAVGFPSRTDHVPISGWWIPASGSGGRTAILAPGYGQNRLIGDIGLPLAVELHGLGWNVLMFDFRASGLSGGSICSIGQYEVRDLLGAADFARQRVGTGGPLVVLGYSMGATVALMAAERDPAISGVLADSPFASLVPYLQQSMRQWTHLPNVPFNWIILRVVPLITGLQPQRVDPLADMAALGKRPVLLIAGTADRLVPDSNARQLAAAGGPGTSLWLVEGAGHIGAWQTAPQAYREHMRAWLTQVAAAPGGAS